MEVKMIKEVNIGDKIKYYFDNDHWGVGELVEIIKAYERPTEDQIIEYYEVAIGDKMYNELSSVIKYDRLVLKKEGNEGGYIVVPNNINLKGKIEIYRGE